ncbi:MAG: hypothetical protein HC841_05095 [Verrucomicrobiae bacterium]|nr:hypothetical protein [Verrucomicrobiae bacterium]
MIIQQWIHKLEEGAGRKIFLTLFAGVAMLGLLVAYDVRVARNFATGEAMDAAQLARNIAAGEGYTTRYVRPMSLWMVEKTRLAGGQFPTNVPRGELALLTKAGTHPDIANAPAYPYLLAGYMRLSDIADAAVKSDAGRAVVGKIGVELNLKAHSYAIPEKSAFTRFPPDYLIHLLNQALFFLTAALVLWLGTRLFEPAVGWTAAGVLIGSELLWRFSASGLPTMLMMLEVTLLMVVLVKLEQGVRTGKSGWPVSILWALAAGLMLGVAMLTRYSLGCLLLPVVLWAGIFCARRGPVLAIIIALVCAAVVAPWLARNMKVSGRPFGIASYAAMFDTHVSGERAESSLDPAAELAKAGFHGYRNKLTSNLVDVFQEEVPKLGGSWLAGMFLAGLLVRFRNTGTARLRLLAVLMLLTLMVTEAMGRTHLSREWPVVNSENLLVLLSPVVFLFGTALFFLLLGQFPMSFPQARVIFAGVFVVVMSLPMVFIVIRARSYPVAYPPVQPAADPEVRPVAGAGRGDDERHPRGGGLVRQPAGDRLHAQPREGLLRHPRLLQAGQRPVPHAGDAGREVPVGIRGRGCPHVGAAVPAKPDPAGRADALPAAGHPFGFLPRQARRAGADDGSRTLADRGGAVTGDAGAQFFISDRKTG